MEDIKGISGEDTRYGIATVQPNRALKKCRIRNLRTEYFLSEASVFLVFPKCCAACDRIDECSDDFVLQIIEKYNDNHKGMDANYYFIV